MRSQVVGSKYTFTLEPYADGTPAPTVVTKETDMALTASFLLARPDFSKTEVVKAEVSAYFQPDSCLRQQDLGVRHR